MTNYEVRMRYRTSDGTQNVTDFVNADTAAEAEQQAVAGLVAARNLAVPVKARTTEFRNTGNVPAISNNLKFLR